MSFMEGVTATTHLAHSYAYYCGHQAPSGDTAAGAPSNGDDEAELASAIESLRAERDAAVAKVAQLRAELDKHEQNPADVQLMYATDTMKRTAVNRFAMALFQGLREDVVRSLQTWAYHYALWLETVRMREDHDYEIKVLKKKRQYGSLDI